jgi:hypothetical protein
MATGVTTTLMPAQFTVTVDGEEVTKQVSEATIKPDVTSTTIRTLGYEFDRNSGQKFTLTLAAYQDWTDPEAESLCWILYNHALEDLDFEIVGEAEDGTTITATGTMQGRTPDFGPTADDAARFSIDLPIVGRPTYTRAAAPTVP